MNIKWHAKCFEFEEVCRLQGSERTTVWWIVMHVNIFQAILGVAIPWYQWLVVKNTMKVCLILWLMFYFKGVNGCPVIGFDTINFYFNFSGYNFSSSNFPPTLLLTLILSIRSSKHVAIVEGCSSCSTNFHENLVVLCLSLLYPRIGEVYCIWD